MYLPDPAIEVYWQHAIQVVAQEYPRPTLEQLNQLWELGELVYTKLNQPGYPSVVAINTGIGVLTKVGGDGGGTCVTNCKWGGSVRFVSVKLISQIKQSEPNGTLVQVEP